MNKIRPQSIDDMIVEASRKIETEERVAGNLQAPIASELAFVDLAQRQLHTFEVHGEGKRHRLVCPRCKLEISLLGRILKRGDGACEA